MDGPMRPNFPPRFEGPPDEFFRGPPGGGPIGPPGIFDEPPHPRHRRYDDRRRHRKDFDEEVAQERPERRSRWSKGSPQQENYNDGEEGTNEEYNSHAPGDVAEAHEEENAGNTTPVRDEPRDVPVMEEEPQPEAEEVVSNQEVTEVQVAETGEAENEQ